MARIRQVILDHTIDPEFPPEAQAEFTFPNGDPLSEVENSFIAITIDRNIRTDQKLRIDWAIINASVSPSSGTETFNPGDSSKLFFVNTLEVGTTEVGTLEISNPQYVSGPVSTPILGEFTSVPFTVIDLTSSENIIWDGTFSSQTWEPSYRDERSEPDIRFHWISVYGRPIQTGNIHAIHVGNGDLLSLVTSPTRGSSHSMKFTIKNSSNGVEPDDCDPAIACEHRRAQIQRTTHFDQYFLHQTTRWLSFSVYVPTDWNILGGSGSFDCVVWGSKPNGASTAGWVGLILNNETWTIKHRYRIGIDTPSGVYWQQTAYDQDTPSADPGGLYPQALADFPNESASRAMLLNDNKGAWTDVIWQWNTDTRPTASNTGFLNLYMRKGLGSWVQVLNLLPIEDFAYVTSWLISNPTRIFDRGIGADLSGDGAGSNIGMYGVKGEFWGRSTNLVLHFDNYKVGNESAIFEQMTHDGSSL